MHVAKTGKKGKIPASSAKTKRGIHANLRVSSAFPSENKCPFPWSRIHPQSSRKSEGAFYRYIVSFEITGNKTRVRLGIGVLEITGDFVQ